MKGVSFSGATQMKDKGDNAISVFHSKATISS